MKKIVLHFIAFLGLIFFQSCDKEMENPTASVIKNISLEQPTTNGTLILNPNLFASTATTIKWTSTDFGYSASVKYVLQIIKSSESFDANGVTPQVVPMGTFNENSNLLHEYAITTTVLNAKLKATGAILGATSGFKIRVYGQPSSQLDSSINGLRAYSQEVVLNCNVYDPIDESPKIYVIGNFGATSTFADWDINLLGTSNSPLIYSAAKNGIYEGFIYMNVASPQFKFAAPTTTDLNLYGVGATPFTGTIVDGITTTGATPSPLGNNPGSLLASTAVSTGNVITTTQGIGTYFVKADLITNKYFAVKRTISVTGTTVSNVAKYLNYDTNPASPYFRMYVGTNITLNAGTGYIQLKDFSSGSDPKQERFGIDATSQYLIPSSGSSSPIKNKIKFSGTSNFSINTPGVYTVVLDLKNSANYNLRIIN